MTEQSRQEREQLEALDRVSKYVRSSSSNVQALPPEVSRVFGLLIDAQANLIEAVEMKHSDRPRRSFITPEATWQTAIDHVEEAVEELRRVQDRLFKGHGAGEPARDGNVFAAGKQRRSNSNSF
jgi:hypothetical protein